jgi:hypothetical protein
MTKVQIWLPDELAEEAQRVDDYSRRWIGWQRSLNRSRCPKALPLDFEIHFVWIGEQRNKAAYCQASTVTNLSELLAQASKRIFVAPSVMERSIPNPR